MKPPAPPPPTISAKEAADRLDVTLKWLYVLLQRGVYQAERIGDAGGWRILVDELGRPLRGSSSTK